MSAISELVTGLDGAIGSAYHREQNQLFFVEYSGTISRLDFIREQSAIVSSGQMVLQGTYRLDLDTGTHSSTGETAPGSYDIFWHQHTETERSMDPVDEAKLATMGDVSFNRISSADLQGLTYTDDPIPGNVNGPNELVDDNVFAVVTNDGNYAKVRVADYGYNIELEWTTYELRAPSRVVGTGYTQPEDIVLSADGTRAYVTERGGALLSVDVDSADRGDATVITDSLSAPHQIALDESRNEAYVVEYDSPGGLVRIDLDSGDQTVLFGDLQSAVGLAITDDQRFAYVTEQVSNGAGSGRLSRVDLVEGHRDVIRDDLEHPFFLTWEDEDEERLVVPERDPTNRIRVIDVPADSVTTLASDVPFRPSSVAVVGPDRLAFCSDDVVGTISLPGATFDTSAPHLLGIGRIPVDYITAGHADASKNGYADTTGDDHDFVVADAPFGGRLPIKLNHERAFEEGYRYYLLKVDGEEPRQTWSDYRWSGSRRQFEYESISPQSGGYYRVREPDEVWYNHWLGYELDTRYLDDGLHEITVEFYARRNRSSTSVSDSVELRIDNQRPRAAIDAIIHQHETDGATPVGTCGIVDDGGDEFTFDVTAYDPQGHLWRYDLRALWGDNESKHVYGETYAEHDDPGPLWHGTQTTAVPPASSSEHPWEASVSGDPTSTRCAHTFYLRVWDRVINGRRRIHRSDYHKSMTLMLDE